MPWSIVASLAGPVINGMMQGDSAQQASQAQQQGTDAAIAESRRQFDLSRGDLTRQNEINRSDFSPWRLAGGSAINRLSQLMGIGGGAASVDRSRFETAIDRGAAPTREQFMLSGGPIQEMWQQPDGTWSTQQTSINGGMVGDGPASSPGQMRSGVEFDDAGYNAALANWNAGGGTRFDQAGYDAAVAQANAAPQDPSYGSLTAPIAPAKKFTLADFWDDPVTKASYQQGLDQGTKALTNMAGARGNLNSGAQLKALARFSTDYTGNQAAGSEGRFIRNENDIYNREVSRRDTLFNRLSGISGTGQTATTGTVNSGTGTANTIAQMGQNTSNTIGGLMSAQGNARGAAAIAGGNAMGGAFSNASNYYQQQQTLDKILNRSSNGVGNYGSGGLISGLPGQYDLNNAQYG